MIGTKLSQYTITAELGEGGMGAVYVAEDTTLNRKVALKVLPVELSGSQERIGRFRREAESLAALNHPNIVRVYGVETDQAVPFLTMELVEGKNLEQLIPEKGMSLEQVLDLAMPMADALAEAHEQGIIHRDLKPANVMVDERGTPKVLDFGLAKLRQVDSDDEGDLSMLATATMTQHGVVLGTIPYMSPEQVQGLPVDQRSDLFSFGAVLYEMITGRRPFGGSSSAAIAGALIRDTPAPASESQPGLPLAMLDLLDRCLEKDPAKRVQTAGEIRDALGDIRSGKAVLAPRPVSGSLGETLWGTPLRRVLVSAAVIAVLILVYFGVSRQRVAPREGTAPESAEAPAPDPSSEASSQQADGLLQRGDIYKDRLQDNPSGSSERFELALEAYKEAFALAPERPEAPARIAVLYAIRMQSGGDPASLIPEVEIWALRAIEIDSTFGPAWRALFVSEQYRPRPNQRKLLEYSFRASEHVTGGYVSGFDSQNMSFFSVILGVEGYLYGIDPRSTWGNVNASINLSMLGRYEEALGLVEDALMFNPKFLGAILSKTILLVSLGRVEEARELAETWPPLPGPYAIFSTQFDLVVALETGDADALGKSLHDLQAWLLNPEISSFFRWPYMAPPTIADLARHGHTEEALELMSQIHEAGLGAPPYDWLRLDQIFDPMRDDPRFRAVEAQAKENFDLMMEYLERARESRPLPPKIEQARVDLIEQLGG